VAYKVVERTKKKEKKRTFFLYSIEKQWRDTYIIY